MALSRTLAALLTMTLTIVAKDRETLPLRAVTACMNPGANAAAVFRAEAVASQLLATAGVKLNWLGDVRSCAGPKSGIVIDLMLNTPPHYHPGAMAYALPYAGTRITLFYDRIQQASVPPLLAHVLAHEITHILQGVALHSTSGIMKERWGPRDYAGMGRKPLAFTDDDKLLIRHGLDVREGRKYDLGMVSAGQ